MPQDAPNRGPLPFVWRRTSTCARGCEQGDSISEQYNVDPSGSELQNPRNPHEVHIGHPEKRNFFFFGEIQEEKIVKAGYRKKV